MRIRRANTFSTTSGGYPRVGKSYNSEVGKTYDVVNFSFRKSVVCDNENNDYFDGMLNSNFCGNLITQNMFDCNYDLDELANVLNMYENTVLIEPHFIYYSQFNCSTSSFLACGLNIATSFSTDKIHKIMLRSEHRSTHSNGNLLSLRLIYCTATF